MYSIRSLIAQSVYHESVEPFTYPYQGDLYVRLRIGARTAERVDVVHFDKFRPQETRVITPALSYSKDGITHEIFQARLTRDTKRFSYYFVIHTANETHWYSRQGLTNTEPTESGDPFEVPYLCERDVYLPPEWTRGTTYYQIFPERYHRGKTAKTHRKKFSKWDEVPTTSSFFGGNLQGVLDQLDYIEQLGIEVIYFTPVFKAPSNHKYDTVDYFAVDPDFGTEEDLRKLVEECHKRGIRVILDAVFNHMGMEHPIFKDVLTNGIKSKYADWIYPKSWPLSMEERNYETFGYIANMPKLRTATPEVEDYLCSVGEYWIKKTGIDGWRLDVSDEVEHTFWKHFRSRLKAVNKDALICGEIWQVATPWLRGDEFDTVMNYPFRRAVIDWLATQTIDAKEFYMHIEKIRTLYPEPVLFSLWNLLDSHDTPRLLTQCAGDVTQARLASFIQFTAIGSPVLYYGDEVGMMGGQDPLCRGGMVWDEASQDRDLLSHYQTLLQLRKNYRSLRTGDFRPLYAGISNQLYAFVRMLHNPVTDHPQETVLCFVNNQKEPVTLSLIDPNTPDGTYKCIYGELEGEIRSTHQVIILPGKSASMWLLVGEKDEY